MIYLINEDGLRLCRDKRWRNHACWGSMPSCVKTYVSMTAARRRAQRLKAKVVQITDDTLSLDASGKIYATISVSDTHNRTETRNIEDYVVFDGTLPAVSA